MALPCPALEGRHEGKPGFHVSSTFLDWNSKEMVWTRTESFREAKGKGSPAGLLPLPHSCDLKCHVALATGH